MTKEKRLIQHNFRTTEAEDNVIRQKMKTFGIRTRASFYRAMILNGYLLKLDLPEIRELLRLMKNLTNNVNQIAKRLNERGSIYDTEIDEILEKQEELWSVLTKILSRLESPTA
ncbi:MAG: plasmid mobilization relaxosome protein MobC [Clostridia bacterium]|nr:plasmid mobilization relaxosome protein MobC [Clostridia bacterium]